MVFTLLALHWSESKVGISSKALILIISPQKIQLQVGRPGLKPNITKQQRVQ